MPLMTCRYCGEEFDLMPGKPGYADECPPCIAERFNIIPDPRQRELRWLRWRREQAELKRKGAKRKGAKR